jgi:DNA-binding PadR family transcriptional regulator
MPPKSSYTTTRQLGRSHSKTNSSQRSIPATTPQLKLNPTAASLLGFLHAGRMTGWELAGTVERAIGNFWNLTRSQIYRELHTLEAAGLVRASETGPRERRPYAITPSGRRAFAAWIATEPEEEKTRFPLLLTMYFADRVPPERLRRFLRQHQLRHERRLEDYERTARALGNSRSGPALTLRFGIEYERAVLRWFSSLPALTGREVRAH